MAGKVQKRETEEREKTYNSRGSCARFNRRVQWQGRLCESGRQPRHPATSVVVEEALVIKCKHIHSHTHKDIDTHAPPTDVVDCLALSLSSELLTLYLVPRLLSRCQGTRVGERRQEREKRESSIITHSLASYSIIPSPCLHLNLALFRHFSARFSRSASFSQSRRRHL